MSKGQDPVITVLHTANALEFLATTVNDEGLSHILNALSGTLSMAGEQLDYMEASTVKEAME